MLRLQRTRVSYQQLSPVTPLQDHPSTSPGLSGTPVHTRIHTHTIIKINLEKENYWIEIYSTIKFEGFSRKIYNFLKIMLYINKEILQILIVNSIIKVASVYHCVNSFSFFFFKLPRIKNGCVHLKIPINKTLGSVRAESLMKMGQYCAPKGARAMACGRNPKGTSIL